MFTGIIEEKSSVKEIVDAGEGVRILISRPEAFKDVSTGESICLSGTCLTVEEFNSDVLGFFLAEETLKMTWFDKLNEGDIINLERSMKVGERLSGHIVQGHVESTAEILEIEELEEGWNMTFNTPEKIGDLIVYKGYIGVEGISLTVTEVEHDFFSVTVIPETWKRTNLSGKSVGDRVNIETDMMGKYAEKILRERED